MNAITIASKLVSRSRIFLFSVLIMLPLSAKAEYYLVYGPPEVPVACCESPRPYYRHVYRVHHKCRHKYYRTVYRRRSHYSITVYYPVPVYTQTYYPYPPCCGGFLEPAYYWAPAPYQVYYTHPDDRLVGNSYEQNYYDPSLDTGTADNDIQ